MNKSKLNPARPGRKQLADFAGRLRTLTNDPAAWEKLGNDKNANALLLLGLGPDNPEKLPFINYAEENGMKIYWIDSPVMKKIRQFQIPSHWHNVNPEKAIEVAAISEIFFYRPGLAIDPDFWGLLLAKVEQANYAGKYELGNSTAWLPGNKNSLLHTELIRALHDTGYSNIFQNLPDNNGIEALAKIWQNRIPSVAISVNFRGLDPEGRIFEHCNALNIPLAIWLVDNPWNLLSGISLPWWRKAKLFITDASFMEPLQKMGAENVFFCPLACAQHMWQVPGISNSNKLLFVGSSAFPMQKAFFRGIKLPDNLEEQANIMLQDNQLPDYHWWSRKLGIPPWPGLAARKIAFGADLFSAKNRAKWLITASKFNLEIIGDENWKNFLPLSRILPPVDYYGQLPRLYHNAFCNLSITSLLLPQSLNQRHFDVWAAGGFLLSDNTEGLKIFQKELTKAVILNYPEELSEKLAWLSDKPGQALELRLAWQGTLQKEHQYIHRLNFIENILKKSAL